MNAAASAKTPFKDHFSGHATEYARYRPTYPDALYEFAAGLPAGRRLALDCATGNGQAARGLATRFARVLGTDASAQQVLAAPRLGGVLLAVAPAERAPVAAHTVDLVNVSQALHWLHHASFYDEVRRVLAPGGALVATMYDYLEAGPAIDAAVQALREVVDPYWPPERAYTTRAGFHALPFGLREEPAGELAMRQDWTLDELLGYLSTWSSVRRYTAAHGGDPVARLQPLFAEAWGDAGERRAIRWPLMVRVGRP